MTDEQPMPVTSSASESVFEAFIADVRARERKGVETYGKSLQTFNGRKALVDAYEEAVDLAVYLKQACMELEQYGGVVERAPEVVLEQPLLDVIYGADVLAYEIKRAVHADACSPCDKCRSDAHKLEQALERYRFGIGDVKMSLLDGLIDAAKTHRQVARVTDLCTGVDCPVCPAVDTYETGRWPEEQQLMTWHVCKNCRAPVPNDPELCGPQCKITHFCSSCINGRPVSRTSKARCTSQHPAHLGDAQCRHPEGHSGLHQYRSFTWE